MVRGKIVAVVEATYLFKFIEDIVLVQPIFVRPACCIGKKLDDSILEESNKGSKLLTLGNMALSIVIDA
jgi:hypothetical protein